MDSTLTTNELRMSTSNVVSLITGFENGNNDVFIDGDGEIWPNSELEFIPF
jgi:hypothetical protein